MITESDVIFTKSKTERFNLFCSLLLETGFSSLVEHSPEQEERLKKRAARDVNYLVMQKLISNNSHENSFMHEFLVKFNDLDRPSRKKLNKYLVKNIREFKL